MECFAETPAAILSLAGQRSRTDSEVQHRKPTLPLDFLLLKEKKCCYWLGQFDLFPLTTDKIQFKPWQTMENGMEVP